jgi:hypothetical protein
MVWTLLDAIASGFAYYLAIVGVLCAGGGLWLLWRRLAILPRAVRTAGTIVRWERQRDSEYPNVFHYFPHVRFTDRMGREHEMRVDVGYNREVHPVGHSLDVRYDPNDPRRAYSASLAVMLAGPVLLTVMGAVGVVAALKAFL